MNTKRIIAKNTSVLGAAKAISMILGLILAIFIARFIGDANLGKLGFAQSFTAILVIFADIGLSSVTVREIARDKELTSKYLGNIFIIKLIFSIGTLGLIVLIINLMHYPADTTKVVYLIGLSSILGTFSEFLRSIFRAFEKMEFEAFLNVGKSIITTGVGLLILFLGYGLIAVALVYLFAGIIDIFATSLVTVRRFARPKLEFDFKFWKQIIILALPFSLTAFIGLIYHYIDIVMLSIMKGDSPAGWYKAACTPIYGSVIIPDIFGFAIFPVMSRFYISSKNALKTTVQKSAKYLFTISLPITIGTILLADRIILLFYGKSFIASIIALQILSLYLPLRFINHVTGYTLSSIDKQPLRAFSATIAAVTNIILNLFLIPRYSLAGAAIATVITEVILFVSYYHFVAKHFLRLNLRQILAKPCLSCVPMGTFIFYSKNANLFILIVSAIVIYFAVFYLLGGVDQEDKAIFSSIMKYNLDYERKQND